MKCEKCDGKMKDVGDTYIMKGNKYQPIECENCNRKAVRVLNGFFGCGKTVKVKE